MAAETLTHSPSPHRFQQHVGFDNIASNEPPTKENPISLTLNFRHDGYQKTRSSRTFMVGVDDNSYSDHALQWLLDELVDDGDEIVCVRVIETQVRPSDKSYQDAAKQLMQQIQSKNIKDLAISLVVEYAVGKLHNTFQSFVSISHPIVTGGCDALFPFAMLAATARIPLLLSNGKPLQSWLGLARRGPFQLLMQSGRVTQRSRYALNEQAVAKSWRNMGPSADLLPSRSRYTSRLC